MTKELIKEREKEKMVDSEVVAKSPAGNIEKVPNLKKRQRSVYYRPVKNQDGSVDWQPTQLLPSDAVGRELYLSKGFRLNPPKLTDTATPNEVTVDQEKETLLAENTKLRQQLQMAKAREARKGNKEA